MPNTDEEKALELNKIISFTTIISFLSLKPLDGVMVIRA